MRTSLVIALVAAGSIQIAASVLPEPAAVEANPPALSLGRRSDTELLPPAPGSECPDSLYVNHDWSFENGFAWGYGGVVAPYYGAFGEGFDMGAGEVTYGAFWFTQVGNYFGSPIDVYLWEGGVSGPPGAVLWVDYGASIPGAIGIWPQVSQHDIEIGCPVSGEVTVGYWADFSASINEFYIAVDDNGPGGHPWTNIAPGIGYPTGWQNPSVVWGACQSLGLGVYFVETFSPVEPRTWGRLKALFGPAAGDRDRLPR